MTLENNDNSTGLFCLLRRVYNSIPPFLSFFDTFILTEYCWLTSIIAHPDPDRHIFMGHCVTFFEYIYYSCECFANVCI